MAIKDAMLRQLVKVIKYQLEDMTAIGWQPVAIKWSIEADSPVEEESPLPEGVAVSGTLRLPSFEIDYAERVSYTDPDNIEDGYAVRVSG